MIHTISNQTIPNQISSKINNVESIEIYELRTNDNYCLATRYSIKDIKDKKDKYFQIDPVTYNKLKIIKINIQFTEI